MTEKTQPEATPEQTAAGKEINDLVAAIPMLRWGKIRRRYDQGVDEMLGNFDVLLILAANEKSRDERQIPKLDNKGDEYERFESMSLLEIQEYLGLGGSDEEAPEEDIKSGPAERDHEPGPGSDQGEGPDLPGPRDFTD